MVVQNGGKCISCLPAGSRACLGAVCCLFLASQERTVPHTASLGKDQKPKFEAHFLLNAYHFCTIIKWKKRKLNHHKSVTISIPSTVL